MLTADAMWDDGMARNSKKGLDGPTAKPGDALSGEVSIRAKVDSSGLTVAGKSRALAAADQLLGGLIGIPGGWVEGIRRRNELRREAREKMLEADLAAAIKRIEGMSELGQAAAERLLRDEYRKQDNRSSIWVAAEEHLLLPQPAQAEPPREAEDGAAADGPTLDQTWLNRFARFAEDISGEELQQVWGRVLAGEIRTPGTFSISTLRVLAEIDPDVARSFEAVYKLSVNGFALKPEKFEGNVLDEYSALEHAGLIQTDSFLQVTIPSQADGYGYMVGKNYLIKITYQPNSSVVSFPAVRITRVGLQIGSILDWDERSALSHIAESLKPVNQVEVCQITARTGNFTQWNVLETLPAKA